MQLRNKRKKTNCNVSVENSFYFVSDTIERLKRNRLGEKNLNREIG